MVNPFFPENFLVTEIGTKMMLCQILRESTPRSDPRYSTLLYLFARLQIERIEFSKEKSDHDKAITLYTEAVLVSQTKDIVKVFFDLAFYLLQRSIIYRQLDDLKSSVKYFRFLRINFHSLEAFGILLTSGDLSSPLFWALAYKLGSTPGDMAQDLEEMIALIPKFITADILTVPQKHAVEAFARALGKTYFSN
ncbi:hypothetical protein V8E53_000800 [Lactarius tabidus]